MLEAIELRNWKTHKSTKLRFAKGTNILVGQMGAGKSSIMDAISFALFGTYPALQHRRVGVEEIITNRPEQAQEASVSLEFGNEGASYMVKRELSLNGTTKATLSKDGAYLQSQAQRVNEEIERILRIDYDLFSRAVYSEQNRLTYFLELRPSERKNQIDRLLGLDRFAAAQENATTLINRIKDMAGEEAKTAASFDIEKLKEQGNAARQELEKLDSDRKKLEEEGKNNRSDLNAVEKKLKEAKAQYSAKISLKQSVAELRSRLDMLDKEISGAEKQGAGGKEAALRRLEEAKARFEELRKGEQKAYELEKETLGAVAKLEAEQKLTGSNLDELVKARKELGGRTARDAEAALAGKKEEAGAARKELEASKAERDESRKWLAELEKHLARCPICERELDEELRKRIVADKREHIGRLEVTIGEHERRSNGAEKEIEALTKEAQQLKLAEAKIAGYGDIEKHMAELSAKLAEAKGANDKARKEKDAAGEATMKAGESVAELEASKERAERLERHREERKKLGTEADAKEAELLAMKVSEGDVEKLQESVTGMSGRVKEISARLESLEALENEKTKQAEDKERQVKQVEALQGSISKKKSMLSSIAMFKDALEETQVALRTRLIGSINGIMHEIWPELYPYGDYKSIVLEPTSDDYVLKVRTSRGGENSWEEVEAIGSGGEKSIACLAMRVAFALVLVPNLRWLILDEPTHNIDQRGLDKFVNAINEVLPRLVEQVFIITHDETLKQVANARVYVLDRDKELGGSTRTEAY